jgi:hypothetical protein
MTTQTQTTQQPTGLCGQSLCRKPATQVVQKDDCEYHLCDDHAAQTTIDKATRPWRIAPYISAKGVHVSMAQLVDQSGNTVAVFENRNDALQAEKEHAEHAALLAVADVLEKLTKKGWNIETRGDTCKALAALAAVRKEGGK